MARYDAAQRSADSQVRVRPAAGEAGTVRPGVYLAEYASKADQYTTADGPSAARALLLCRATLGRFRYVNTHVPTGTPSDSDGDDRIAPHPAVAANDLAKQSQRPRRNVRPHPLEREGFTSVVGQLPGRPYREFCVFAAEQVFPMYLVTYNRRWEPSP